MKPATSPRPTIEHPPLAQDGQGNLLPLPDGTCAWRLSRHTGGRPRVVNGPDLAPLRLPLHVTVEDLIDICGPGVYRLYALDEVGNVLDYVTNIEVGAERRNAAPVEPEAVVFTAHQRGQSSDLRYALEALTHITRTCADSLRAVSEAQADWVKTIAMAKGLPRNVAMLPPVVNRDGSDDDDEEDDEDEEPHATEPKSGIEAFTAMVAPYVPGFLDSWSGTMAAANDDKCGSPNPMAHLARIQAQLTPNERQFLDLLLQDAACEAITKELASRTIEDAVAMIRRQAVGAPTPPRPAPRLDPSTMEKLTAIAALLEPAERARLMKLGPKLLSSPEAIELANTLAPLSPEAAAEWVRSNLDEIEARFAS